MIGSCWRGIISCSEILIILIIVMIVMITMIIMIVMIIFFIFLFLFSSLFIFKWLFFIWVYFYPVWYQDIWYYINYLKVIIEWVHQYWEIMNDDWNLIMVWCDYEISFYSIQKMIYRMIKLLYYLYLYLIITSSSHIEIFITFSLNLTSYL